MFPWLIAILLLVLIWATGYAGTDAYARFRSTALRWVAIHTLPILALNLGLFFTKQPSSYDRMLLNKLRRMYLLYFVIMGLVPISFKLIDLLARPGFESNFNEMSYLKDSYWLLIPLQLAVISYLFIILRNAPTQEKEASSTQMNEPGGSQWESVESSCHRAGNYFIMETLSQHVRCSRIC